MRTDGPCINPLPLPQAWARAIARLAPAAELALLAAVALAFAAPLANLDPTLRAPGLEHERLSGVLIPAQVGLQQYGRIPMWNPYVFTGEPFINNPFNYLFNPFASLPALALGAVNGTKLAIVLAILIAGLSMWALARALGLGAVARLAAATLYLCNGQIAGKFEATMGHFQLGVSLAWPPLVFAGLWLALTTRRRWPPALAAVAFALLFFSGNVYYTLHTLVCAAVMTVFFLFRRPVRPGGVGGARRERGWRLDGAPARRAALAGAFAVGLAAAQFLPLWEARRYVAHPGDPELYSATRVETALAGYLWPFDQWKRLKDDDPNLFPGVDYSYVGPVALAALLLPVVALRRRDPAFDWRAPAVALALFLLMFAWATGLLPPLNWLYARIPLLAQFRYVGRVHAIAVIWLAVMVGFGIDTAWRRIWQLQSGGRITRLAGQVALAALLLLGLGLGLSDVHRVNGRLLIPVPTGSEGVRTAYGALKGRADTVEYYFTRFDAYDAYYSQVKNWGLHEGWWPATPPDAIDIPTALNVTPRYVVFTAGDRDGQRYAYNNDYTFLGAYPAGNLDIAMYERTNRLPYAFVTTRAELHSLGPRDRLTAGHVQEAVVVAHEIDRFTVQARGEWPGEDILVVLESHYPGWRVEVDGASRPLLAVGNYLGVEAELGVHTYTFWFRPLTFDVGLLVSAMTLALMVVYLFARRG